MKEIPQSQFLFESITNEVLSCFTRSQLDRFETFEEFYDEVDVINAHEDNWRKGKYKAIYKRVYNSIKKGKI